MTIEVSVQTKLRVAADYMDGILLEKIRERYKLRTISQVTRIALAAGAQRRDAKFVRMLTKKVVQRGKPFQPGHNFHPRKGSHGDQSGSSH